MNWNPEIAIADITGTLSLLAVCLSLVAVARSNRKLTQSMQLSTLQAMISEMNGLREMRSENPDLERSLFDSRESWSDTQIQHNLTAVQFANIFEWAYIARRDGLLEQQVWDSWVETWRNVILASRPLRESFTDNVWTFGRTPEVAAELNQLVSGSGLISDPCKRKNRFWSRIAGV